jgi:hypothetical protein
MGAWAADTPPVRDVALDSAIESSSPCPTAAWPARARRRWSAFKHSCFIAGDPGQPCPATHPRTFGRQDPPGRRVCRWWSATNLAQPCMPRRWCEGRLRCDFSLAKARLTTAHLTMSLSPSHRSLPAHLLPSFQSRPCSGRVSLCRLCVSTLFSPFPTCSALPAVLLCCLRRLLSGLLRLRPWCEVSISRSDNLARRPETESD